MTTRSTKRNNRVYHERKIALCEKKISALKEKIEYHKEAIKNNGYTPFWWDIEKRRE